MPEALPPDAEALAEWLALTESLLRGLVHSLNNRLTALAAFGELAALGDAEFAPHRVLPAELERLQALGALLRLLVSDDRPAEAMELRVVVDEAVALHAQHSASGGVRSHAVLDGAPTVRAPRWAILRLLVALLESGRRAAAAAGREEAVLRVTADDAWVSLRADAGGETPAAASRYAMAMAALCGAAPAREAAPAEIRIPTLLELRRRERLVRETT